MSEPATATPDRYRRLYLFGQSPDDKGDPPPPIATDVLKFLQGHDVPLTPELADALRKEFSKQEAVRVKCHNLVAARAQEFARRAGDSIKDHAKPLTPAQVGARSYEDGLYQAYSTCAQETVEDLNSITAEVMEP